MTWKCEKVQESPLPPAGSEEEYLLHQAALEWCLADSIVIQTVEDIQSKAGWRDRLDPFQHQVQNLFTFCRRLPVSLLADDVGLGKTISAGLILSELMARKRVTRALVLCPKILCPQWVEELAAKFGIAAVSAVGERLDEELVRNVPVVVTTYDSAASRLADLKPAAFDMLILDEAHKLRNLHGSSNKSPKMATAVRDALQKRLFRFVVMLTATPIQNRIWDLYSLIDCLTVAKGHKNPLGTPEEFKKRYLLASDGRHLKPQETEEFRRILRQYVVRTRRGDANLQFPTREVRLVKVDLSPQEKDLTRLVAGHIGDLNALQQISLAQAMMSSPRALAAQLENMSGKNPLLRDAAQEARTQADACKEPAKLGRLLLLCDELKASRPRDWRVVVFTGRKETQVGIGEALEAKGIPVGYIRGSEARKNQLAIEGLRADPPSVHVLVSTDAGAEGVNLQAANVLVNYDLPWNPMVVEQRIGRLQRLSSRHANVLIRNLVAAGSVEERVVGRLMEKLQGIAQAIGDIESILESPELGGEEGSFEDQIRDLVVKSLLGQDIEEATRLAQESIDRARKQIEEQRIEIDRTLGSLDELHHAGPSMPRLGRAAPAIPAQEFVLRARGAEGGIVRETSAGVFEVRTPGRSTEVIVFDDKLAETLSSQAVFMGKVKLYQPGKTEFERLLQHWVDRSGHHICDLRQRTASDADHLARSWCLSVPEASYLGCRVISRDPKFQGVVSVRVKASNGVDGYEKLVSTALCPEGHRALPSDKAAPSDYVNRPAQLSEAVQGCSALLARAVEADGDLSEFCRFYEARRSEELAAAGNDPRLQHKVNEDFTPSVAADIVGYRGIRYNEVRMRVRFSVRGEGDYEADLLAVPVSGQLLESPALKVCGHTGLFVPADCLEACQLTGEAVLKHLLIASEDSGRRGLRDRAVTCQVTGKKVLEDEVACSGVSGTVGIKATFVTCRQTGCLLLPSEAGTSAVSGKVVRTDLLSASEKPPHRLGLSGEFGTCEVTGNRLLTDELGRSAVSGKVMDRGLLRPSARSGRLAREEELVICQESGAVFLPEETEMCVLTGKRADIRLLTRSDVSGRLALSPLLERCTETGKLALPSELEACELTGAKAVPDEMATCAVTGKRALRSRMASCQQTGAWLLPSEASESDFSGKTVRRSLLISSDKAPGRAGLLDEFALCEVTGRRLLRDELARSFVSRKLIDRDLLRKSALSGALALEDELERCALTNALVLPGELETCAVSGVRGVRGNMLRSEVSGRYVVPAKAIRSAISGKVGLPVEAFISGISGRIGLSGEAVRCAWLGQPVLVDEARECTLTRQVVATRFLNGADELAPLRELLDGQSRDVIKVDDLISRLVPIGGEFLRGLSHVWVAWSPNRQKLAVCGEVRSWFGLKVRHVGFLLETDPEFQIIGRASGGHRSTGGWLLESGRDFPRKPAGPNPSEPLG